MSENETDRHNAINQSPAVTVELTFLPYAEGGRVQLPDFASANYMPHLVVQNPDVRQATRKGRYITDDYLGVRFIEGPQDYIAGQPCQFRLELMYWPRMTYDTLQVGATFTVREGARIIGYGTLLGRQEPPIGQGK